MTHSNALDRAAAHTRVHSAPIVALEVLNWCSCALSVLPCYTLQLASRASSGSLAGPSPELTAEMDKVWQHQHVLWTLQHTAMP